MFSPSEVIKLVRNRFKETGGIKLLTFKSWVDGGHSIIAIFDLITY